MPETTGGCPSSGALSQLKDGKDFCIQFPGFFDMKDVSHAIWPTCLGLYPLGSIIFSRSTLTAVTGEELTKKEELEKEKAALLIRRDEVGHG